jgi:hypothetical protein
MPHLVLTPTTLLPFAEGWTAPNREELRAVIEAAGLDTPGCARFVGESRKAVNRWTTGAETIPYACWALLCQRAGLPTFWESQTGHSEFSS